MQPLRPLTFSNFVIFNYYVEPQGTLHSVTDCKFNYYVEPHGTIQIVTDCKFQKLQTVNRNDPTSKRIIHIRSL